MITVNNRDKFKNRKIVIVAAVVLSAIICRIVGKIPFHYTFFSLLRSLLYIGLYIGWGISVSKRVIQKPVQYYLLSIAGLMVFWFIVRTIKYLFSYTPEMERHLWYCYYISMLMIPLMALLVAILLGKPANASLPKWAKLLYIPTLLCLFLVLTNDWHQMVFAFPAGSIWTDKNNSYELGYYVVLGWEVLCALVAFLVMVVKSRHSQRKKYLPVLLLLVSIVYALIYASGVEWMQMIGGDIAAVQCLLVTAILESCIQCGLIPTNTGYEELFEVGTMGAQITDMQYRPHYSSSNAMQLSEDTMRAAEDGSIALDKNILLKSSPIRGGHVLWQEDITDITLLLERLEENRKTIEDSNFLEEENYKTKVKINTLREKNRLYDRLQKQTIRQVDFLDSLLNQYETESNPEIARGLLAKIGVIGAYIKRRGNLLFINEKSEVTDTVELIACLEESFLNLKLMGIDCALDIPTHRTIPVKDAAGIYDFFEEVIEKALDDIHSVWLKGRDSEHEILIYLEIESEIDLSTFVSLADSGIYEDSVWRFTLHMRKVGEQA